MIWLLNIRKKKVNNEKSLHLIKRTRTKTRLINMLNLCRLLFYLGFPTVMPRVELKNLSENVLTLKDNVSSLEEISVMLSKVCK